MSNVQKLKGIITDLMEDKNLKIEEAALLKNDLGLNSLKLLQLIDQFQVEFNIQLNASDYTDDNFRSFGSIVSLINTHQNN